LKGTPDPVAPFIAKDKLKGQGGKCIRCPAALLPTRYVALLKTSVPVLPVCSYHLPENEQSLPTNCIACRLRKKALKVHGSKSHEKIANIFISIVWQVLHHEYLAKQAKCLF